MTSFRGFFGKLPARGDFVNAGLPRDFVSRWDVWISSTLPAALAATGDGWLALPARRFRLAPGMYGVDTVTGVLFPSADKVGRLFVLTLAWTEDGVDINIAERWGRAAIANAMAPDALAARLSKIPITRRVPMTPPVLRETVTFATMMSGNLP